VILQLAQDVTAGLVERGFPVDAHYGTQVLKSGAMGLRVAFGRDTRGGDLVEAVIGAQRNPKGIWSRQLGVIVVLHVASGLASAMLPEHEHECDDLVDGLLTELFTWCSTGKALVPVIVESAYVAPDEVPLIAEVYGMPAHPAPVEGVAYVLRFRISRGVTRRDYDGSAATEVAAGDYSVSTDTERVAIPGGDWETIEAPEE